ncbi:MAG: hypothetical protein IPJ84_13410 [Bdellovibrionales bacterium]|nr:hypothetical protein [Bdellovibrionales bacterium]
MNSLTLAVLVFLNYWPLFLEKVKIKWDTYDYSFPLILYLRDAFASGVFPLWNPFILSGDAMFAQPAASVYHPFYLLAALAPQGIETFRVVTWLCLLLPAIQALGYFRLFSRWSFSRELAFAGAFTLGVASFGPLLGQITVAFGMALFPWLLLATENLIVASLGSERLRRSLHLGLLGVLAIAGSYFGVLVFTLSAMVVLLIRRRLKNLRYFVLAGVLAIAGSAFFLAPAIENRATWYSSIASDFVSPDVRMRGQALTKEQVVDIVKNERHLLSVLTGILSIEPGRPHWVMGFGYLWLVLALSSLVLIRREKKVRWLWLATVVLASYVMGPRSAVFDFVFAYGPVVKNIRYPVFAFYLLLLALTLLALSLIPSLSHLVARRSKFSAHSVQRLFVLLLLIDATVFFQLSGIFDGRAIDIFVRPQEVETLEARTHSVQREIGLRSMQTSASYDFSNRRWIQDKVLISHGYSTSDSPLYWYMKDWKGLAQPVWPVRATKSYPVEPGTRLSNHDLEKIRTATLALQSGEVFSATNSSWPDDCVVSKIRVSPNEWEFHVDSKSACLVAVTDKNYPGWEVAEPRDGSVSLETIQWIFKGVRISGEGSRTVRLKFQPRSFYLGLLISAITLILTLVALLRLRLYCPQTIVK